MDGREENQCEIFIGENAKDWDSLEDLSLVGRLI
jgi:hypothetical protein